jgi:hypothetical protein
MWKKYQIRRIGGCLRHDSGKIAARVFSSETLAPRLMRVETASRQENAVKSGI